MFNEKKAWFTKDGNDDFDVPIGCFDEVEVCELVDAFILNKLKKFVP